MNFNFTSEISFAIIVNFINIVNMCPFMARVANFNVLNEFLNSRIVDWHLQYLKPVAIPLRKKLNFLAVCCKLPLFWRTRYVSLNNISTNPQL